MNILYELGQYGPFILIFLSWYLLWNNKNLLFYYTIGIFINSILNIILKGIFQQPRPTIDNKKVNLVKLHAKQNFFRNGIPFDIFGMPSGHAQSTFFTTVYIYLALKQINLLYIFLFFSILICFQRVKFDYHTISQVIVGAIVGSAFGYVVYTTAREKMKGTIKEKPDDDAPI